MGNHHEKTPFALHERSINSAASRVGEGGILWPLEALQNVHLGIVHVHGDNIFDNIHSGSK